ncbi:hypothetical protein [Fontivita pretiosa]|uniref:DUF7901 domain-containing protein n=1 Tax=Fontivita pretiosa TaxID=2989684 RepID=UPI003D185C6B
MGWKTSLEHFPDGHSSLPFRPRVGWKTSLEHFQDDAVWDDLPLGAAPWQELRDPTGISLDMAFAITPEPTMAVLGLCGMSLLRRRR